MKKILNNEAVKKSQTRRLLPSSSSPLSSPRRRHLPSHNRVVPAKEGLLVPLFLLVWNSHRLLEASVGYSASDDRDSRRRKAAMPRPTVDLIAKKSKRWGAATATEVPEEVAERDAPRKTRRRQG
jgi:hypothetical protein